jgi:tRNA A-37 threonylcarbamoyl transferase component Bud32
LDDALALARSQAAALALQRAHDAGASAPTVSFSQEDNAVTNDIDGHLFFEARITATASGAPVTKIV